MGSRRNNSKQTSSGGLGRAIRYLGKQRRSTIIAYGALLFATIAQLAVPQLVQNMIDAVTNGTIANGVLQAPAFVQNLAVQQLGKSVDQLRLDQVNAESLLISAALLIVAFA